MQHSNYNCKNNENFYILGIETSCDDLAMGLIDGKGNIINECKYSLDSKNYGGIVPELAARMHANYLDVIFKKTVGNYNINAIGATVGPGLISSVVLGAEFAKTYAKINNIPFIPVHHLEGHIYASRFTEYPFLAFLISGGHSDLYLCKGFGQYELILKTLDDSAGEVFDKLGRQFGLNFPCGPEMEQLANHAIYHINPVIIMKNQLALSFSGLKTKALRMNESVENISWFLQESIGLTLKEKLMMAINKTSVNNVIICGGVAANQVIRSHISSIPNINVIFPPINLCMDNGPMIAYVALDHLNHNSSLINKFNQDEFSRMTINEFYSKFS